MRVLDSNISNHKLAEPAERVSTHQCLIGRILADREYAALKRCLPFFEPRESGRGAT
jgi:hypothetical protein